MEGKADMDDDGVIVHQELFTDDASRCHWATGAVYCVACEHRWVAVVPAVAPYYSYDTGALNLLECPECGKLTGCSE